VEKSAAAAIAALCMCLAAACSGGATHGDAWVAPDETAAEEAAQEDDGAAQEDGPEAQDTAEAEAADAPSEPSCPTWAQVQPVLRSRCGSCHAGYTTYDGVAGNVSAVRAYVQMGHHISGTDRQLVLGWIDCGAPR